MPKNVKHHRRHRVVQLAQEPARVPEIEPAFETRMSERSLIRQYLLWHATQICNGSCLLCQDAIAWLAARDAVPEDLYKLLKDTARRPAVGGS